MSKVMIIVVKDITVARPFSIKIIYYTEHTNIGVIKTLLTVICKI